MQIIIHVNQGKIDKDSPKLVHLLDEYSIIIQEFFQARVRKWLETVGKYVFNIQHYWCQFEFAPSHGQIHAHMLAICGNKSFNITMHELCGDKEAQAQFVQSFAKKAYNYEANVDLDLYQDMIIDKSSSFCSVCFQDVGDRNADVTYLQRFCQHHECSGYCL